MNRFTTLLLLMTILAMSFVSQPVSAHLNSMSFSNIEVKEGEIRWEMKFTLLCTLELFAVDVDSNNFLSKEELKSAWSMMYYYLSNKIKVMTDGKQLRMVLKDISFSIEEEDSFTVFELSFPFRGEHNQFIFLCNVQEETDPYHQALAEIHLPDASYAYVFSNVNYFDTANISRFARKFDREELEKEKQAKKKAASSSNANTETTPEPQSTKEKEEEDKQED